MNSDILAPLVPFLLGVFSIINGFTYTKKEREYDKKLKINFFWYIADYIPVWIYRIMYVIVGIVLVTFGILGWM